MWRWKPEFQLPGDVPAGIMYSRPAEFQWLVDHPPTGVPLTWLHEESGHYWDQCIYGECLYGECEYGECFYCDQEYILDNPSGTDQEDQEEPQYQEDQKEYYQDQGEEELAGEMSYNEFLSHYFSDPAPWDNLFSHLSARGAWSMVCSGSCVDLTALIRGGDLMSRVSLATLSKFCLKMGLDSNTAASAESCGQSSSSTTRLGQDSSVTSVSTSSIRSQILADMEDDYEPLAKGKKAKRVAVRSPKSVAEKKAKAGKWAPDNVMENPTGPLSSIDIKAVLMNPLAWSGLSQEEQDDLRSLVPADQQFAFSGPDEIDHSIFQSEDFTHGIARFEEDHHEGRNDKEWQRQAITASAQRQNGEFNDFEDKKLMEDWGIDVKAAGGSG